MNFDEWVTTNGITVATKITEPCWVWVDTETTGLDWFQDDIVEIGLVLTNAYGEVIPNSLFTTLVFPPMSPKAVWNKTDSFAAEMHKASGLEDDWWAADDDLADANTYPLVDKQMREWVSAFGNPLNFRWAGSTIEFDKALIKRTMPKFGDALHYRSVNVSSLKEIAAKLNKPVSDAYVPLFPASRHRPVSCLGDSLREYQYYLNELLMVDWTEHDSE